jgi:hypothetical protein
MSPPSSSSLMHLSFNNVYQKTVLNSCFEGLTKTTTLFCKDGLQRHRVCVCYIDYALAVSYTLLYKYTDTLTYVRVKRLQWAGRIVKIFNITIPKRNLGVSEEKGPPETDKWVGRRNAGGRPQIVQHEKIACGGKTQMEIPSRPR